MIKGLLVDFGGVLTTSVIDAFAEFARGEGLDPKDLAAVMREHMQAPDSFFLRVERGHIDTADFEIELAGAIRAKLGVEIASTGLKSRLFAGSRPNEPMLDALRRARANGVRTALVSNSWGVTEGGYPVHQFDELFDAIVISGEVGLRKPDPEIYLLAAERIAAEPPQCIFVDDFAINVEGAVATGMAGVHHVETDATLRELEAFLSVPLR
ncbi:MAG TPA: HAD family phosphatase [Actinomycetota bacterium]|nr:HAD family phosphatase [Actinomycetota bacterium]